MGFNYYSMITPDDYVSFETITLMISISFLKFKLFRNITPNYNIVLMANIDFRYKISFYALSPGTWLFTG
jgi:hypothetical protein